MKKRYIKYVPHGVNQKVFYPIKESHPEFEQLINFKNSLFNGKEYDFILFFNSRNIRRKQIQDTILAYKLFIDNLTKEQASKCILLMHTQPVDVNGTDIPRYIKDIIIPNSEHEFNYLIHDKIVPQKVMNYLYNISTCQILLSSNEGWGLSLTEALMCGKPIIANVTGGMQDQLGFYGLEFDEKFTSNNIGKFTMSKPGTYPVFPTNISIQGSPQTPYISDDRCSPEDAANQILTVYNIPKDKLEKISEDIINRVSKGGEQDYSSETMGERIIDALDTLLSEWQPREKFNFIKL